MYPPPVQNKSTAQGGYLKNPEILAHKLYKALVYQKWKNRAKNLLHMNNLDLKSKALAFDEYMHKFPGMFRAWANTGHTKEQIRNQFIR